MKRIAKIVAGMAVAVLFVIGALMLPAVQTWLVVINLPDFPDWPEAREQLDAGDEGEIYFRTQSPFDLEVILGGKRGVETTGLGWLTFPDEKGEATMPAMVILPGSGGIKPGREHEYAMFLNEMGIAAFVIEYYLPRGLDEDVAYLIRTGSVTEFDLISDAYAALTLLASHPAIDGGRIGVVGFSYGGMAARLAMDNRIRESLTPDHPGFSAHIDVYGPCFQNLGTEKTNGAPLLTLRGTEDASNDLEACAQREDELRALGVDVEAIVYDGAGHAWENSQPRFFSEQSPYVQGCEWGYDDKGVPLVNGERLVSYDGDVSRPARIAARLRLGTRLTDCVRYGYIIGRDEETRDKAFADAARFLRQHL